VVFIADAIVSTVGQVRDTGTALTRLVTDWEGRRKFRANSAARRALAVLPSYPVITTFAWR
jgi:hypothetical protein